MKIKRVPFWNSPKSMCVCGHTGDGFNSQHNNSEYEAGHGACTQCECVKFTWANFTVQYQLELNKRKEARDA